VALRVLKKKMQCGGTFRAMKRERAYKNHRSAGRARCPRLSEVTVRCCANGSNTKALIGYPWILQQHRSFRRRTISGLLLGLGDWRKKARRLR
jgi:hypothetical protein